MPLCCGSLSNLQEELGASAPWSFEARRQRRRPSDLVWSGVDDLCAGDVETPSLVEKLLSETRNQGNRDCVHGRDLIAEKQYF